jgi:hypothetical protein
LGISEEWSNDLADFEGQLEEGAGSWPGRFQDIDGGDEALQGDMQVIAGLRDLVPCAEPGIELGI